jgi:hypothetical protein
VTLEIGLGIGRLVFSTLNKVEILLLFLWVLSLISIVNTKEVSGLIVPMVIMLLLLLLQTALLLPELDARASIIIQGTMPPSTSLHWVYILCEVVKLVLLLYAAYNVIKVPPFKLFPIVNTTS